MAKRRHDARYSKELWITPIETISESEEGFERVYQGSQILAVRSLETRRRQTLDRRNEPA